MKEQFYVQTTLNVMFPYMYPYTNRTAMCTWAYNDHYLCLSSAQNVHHQGHIESEKNHRTDVDFSGKGVSIYQLNS